MKEHGVPQILNRYLSLIVVLCQISIHPGLSSLRTMGRRNVERVVGVAVLALLILLCVPSRVAFADSKSPAFVRIIHASPDIGIVDAFVDGTKILSSFQFGTVTDCERQIQIEATKSALEAINTHLLQYGF